MLPAKEKAAAESADILWGVGECLSGDEANTFMNSFMLLDCLWKSGLISWICSMMADRHKSSIEALTMPHEFCHVTNVSNTNITLKSKKSYPK